MSAPLFTKIDVCSTTLFTTMFVIRFSYKFQNGNELLRYWGNHGKETEKTPKIFISSSQVRKAITSKNRWLTKSESRSVSVVCLRPVGSLIAEVAEFDVSVFLEKKDLIDRIFR